MSGTAARKISSAPPVLFKRMGGIKSKNHIVEAHHFYTLPPAGHPHLPHTSPALHFSMTERCHPEELNGESVQIIADVQDLKSIAGIK